MTAVEITIPWPPSVNRYWRSVKGRVLISKEGRQYRGAVVAESYLRRWPNFGGARLFLDIEAHPPDKRRRDLDNVLKAALDALEAAGVYANDSQVDLLKIRRREPVAGGKLVVFLGLCP